jgi:hypothetical protein
MPSTGGTDRENQLSCGDVRQGMDQEHGSREAMETSPRASSPDSLSCDGWIM